MNSDPSRKKQRRHCRNNGDFRLWVFGVRYCWEGRGRHMDSIACRWVDLGRALGWRCACTTHEQHWPQLYLPTFMMYPNKVRTEDTKHNFKCSGLEKPLL